MLRRLTMIAVGLGIIGFCMAVMPQKTKGESIKATGVLKLYGKHKHKNEQGTAWAIQEDSDFSWTKYFTTNKKKKYKVKFYGLPADSPCTNYTGKVKGKCKASAEARGICVKPGKTTSRRLNY